MKKVSALLLTAVLGSSMVFASFTGNASLSAKYDTATKDYGFANGSSAKFNIDLLNEKAENATSEKAIYAKIKASLRLGLVPVNLEKGIGYNDPTTLIISTGTPVTGSDAVLGLALKLDQAAVVGDGWTVDITGPKGGVDYAKSTIDSVKVKGATDDWGVIKADYDDFFNYKPVYNKKLGGFNATIGSSILGVGFNHVEGTGTDATVYVGGKDYQVSEGLTFSGAVAYSQTAVTLTSAAKKDVAAGLKVAYEANELTATVASDFGYDVVAEKANADVSASVKYAPVTVDAYYATKASAKGATEILNLLSVKVATDLKSFDLPLTVTLKGKDLVNAQKLAAEFKYAATDALTLTVSGDYGVKDTSWSGKLATEYKVEEVGTIKASASLAKGSIVAVAASVENKTLVDNATLSLKWADADDLLKKDATKTDFGSITAKINIAF